MNVHAERTLLTEYEAATALKEGWVAIIGSTPTVEQLALLWAQTALETGRFKSIWCYNFGNVKYIEGHDYYMIRCDEYINGKHVWFDPPHKATWFNAYTSAEKGAEEHIKFLSNKSNYKACWAEVLNGDPVAFSHQLKLAKYYTADENLYVKGVVSLFNEIIKKIKDQEIDELYK